MSAETAPTPGEHIIPQGLLEDSIKITNEPPTGMLANLHAALYNFDQVKKQRKSDTEVRVFSRDSGAIMCSYIFFQGIKGNLKVCVHVHAVLIS